MIRYVRWKRYGFTHIVDEEKQNVPWRGVSSMLVNYTVCGNWYREGYDFYDPRSEWERKVQEGKLAPSETNDDKRPLCGNCKKYLEKVSNK